MDKISSEIFTSYTETSTLDREISRFIALNNLYGYFYKELRNKNISNTLFARYIILNKLFGSKIKDPVVPETFSIDIITKEISSCCSSCEIDEILYYIERDCNAFTNGRNKYKYDIIDYVEDDTVTFVVNNKKLSLSYDRYKMLLDVYNGNNARDDIIKLLLRYNCIEGSTNYNASLPNDLYKYINETFGDIYECFASPLNFNKVSKEYYSAYYDTDNVFGSKGNIFEMLHKCVTNDIGGVFVANPPYIEDILNALYYLSYAILESCTSQVTFFITLPNWDDCNAIKLFSTSEHLTCKISLSKYEHKYISSKQYTTNKPTYCSYCNSIIVILQNSKTLVDDSVRDNIIKYFS